MVTVLRLEKRSQVPLFMTAAEHFNRAEDENETRTLDDKIYGRADWQWIDLQGIQDE